MNSYYTQYYLNQGGSGLSDIGGFYRLPVFHQRGRGGIGNFFTGVLKYLNPFLSSGYSAIKDQALKSGSAILSEVGKKPFRNILKEQGQIAVNNLAERGFNKIKKMQRGSGRRIKRGRVSKRNHSTVKRRRKRKRKTKTSKTTVKRHRRPKKRRGVKKSRFVDIFSNNI